MIPSSVFEEWTSYAKEIRLKLRHIDIERLLSNSNIKIVGISGIRRCGKSSLLMLAFQNVVAKGKKACYLYLEDGRIKNEKDALDQLIKWFGDNGFLFLDEITNITGWESWLSRMHEQTKGKLHILVSSSRGGIATPQKPLRGRILNFDLYPLSFTEFLEFKGVSPKFTIAGIGNLEKDLEEYLIYGGFPEIALSEDKTDKVRIINSYFKDIIALDIAEITRIDINAVELFAKYALESTYFSASKCLNFYKSVGYKIGKEKILSLEWHSQAAYLFFFIPIFSYNIKDETQYPRKCYAGDTGFLYSISGKKDIGRLYENAVFLELKRRLKPNEALSYWKDKDGSEVDFVILEGTKPREIIQVAYDLDNEKTKKRELIALVKAAKEFNLKKGMIITRNIEDSKRFGGVRIKFVPLWKWLLGRSS